MSLQSHLVVGALAACLGAAGAWTIQGWRFDAREAARLEQEREAARANAKTADKASEGHEQAKAEIRTEFKTIYRDVARVVEKPVYKNVCLDEDGIDIINRAIADPAKLSKTE